MLELIIACVIVLCFAFCVVMHFVSSAEYSGTMTIIIVIISMLYLIYIVAEQIISSKERKKIGKVIHVNGIRGKSTVTRLIDAGLRGCGYKVMSKTTGTIPTIIDVNNNSVVIKRLGKANIREQIRMIHKASKDNVDFLVLECMAVNPELQYVCENNILHADINVVTNVRADHLDEMGDDLESIAYSLANTTPRNGTLVLGEGAFKYIFDKCAEKLNTKVVVAKPYEEAELLDTFADNIATALAVCDELGLDRSKFFEGMRHYIHDPGSLTMYQTESTQFINGFSINDPESTLIVYDMLGKVFDLSKVTVLLNERPDRPFRINQHIEMLTKMQFKKLIVVGSNIDYIKKHLKDKNITVNTIGSVNELLDEQLIFGCGNIASDGMKVIDFFAKNGTECEVFNGKENGGKNG